MSDPRLVKAMAHPLRVQILNAVAEEDHSPSELADMLEAPLGNVSYHVRQLADMGLLKLVKRTPRRGAIEHHYRAVQAAALMAEGAWNAMPGTVKGGVAAAALAEVGAVATASASGGGFDRPQSVVERRTLRLDEAGWKAVAKAAADFDAAIAKVPAVANGDGVPAQVVTLVFEERDPTPQPAKRGRPAKRKS